MQLFEWDGLKDQLNVAKHGIAFLDAAAALGDPYRVTWPDLRHSIHEDRYQSICSMIGGRIILVVTTMAEDGTIRIISARRATKRERHAYETRRRHR